MSRDYCKYCGSDDVFGCADYYSCRVCAANYHLNDFGDLIKSKFAHFQNQFYYTIYLFFDTKKTMILIKEEVGYGIYSEINRIKLDCLLDITPSNIADFVENRLEKLKVML